ncbi:hypothetical protein [Phytohabitans suffuscus]|uniref:hypothetical protein n=1 Tax=Phytohabitans suffuscus TaxID=624315 RepID=UPI00156433A2|nr:hypothetical protein [Phytohabitans suffuscus]
MDEPTALAHSILLKDLPLDAAGEQQRVRDPYALSLPDQAREKAAEVVRARFGDGNDGPDAPAHRGWELDRFLRRPLDVRRAVCVELRRLMDSSPDLRFLVENGHLPNTQRQFMQLRADIHAKNRLYAALGTDVGIVANDTTTPADQKRAAEELLRRLPATPEKRRALVQPAPFEESEWNNPDRASTALAGRFAQATKRELVKHHTDLALLDKHGLLKSTDRELRGLTRTAPAPPGNLTPGTAGTQVVRGFEPTSASSATGSPTEQRSAGPESWFIFPRQQPQPASVSAAAGVTSPTAGSPPRAPGGAAPADTRASSPARPQRAASPGHAPGRPPARG